jgi:hypothetical protein
MPTQPDHFKFIFYFICAFVGTCLLYQLATTFIHIPKENQRNADTVLTYMLSLESGCIGFLIGQNMPKKDSKITPLRNPKTK